MFLKVVSALMLLPSVALALYGEGLLDEKVDTPLQISGATIISNAQMWLNPCVPYSTSSYHAGTDGNTYRQDCSGYVSMAWKLGSSQTTSTLASFSTKISKSELSAGDILLNAGSHTLIFDKWADDAKTHYWTYEQHPDCTEYHSVEYPYWSNYDPSGYKPYRSNKVSSTFAADNSTLPM
jgi:hypothetical protein